MFVVALISKYSHYSLQCRSRFCHHSLGLLRLTTLIDSDGIAGPLIIDGPTSENWQEDLGSLLITDWYRGNSTEIFHNIELKGGVPAAKSMLVNGKSANFPCDPNDRHCKWQNAEWFIQKVKPNTTYKCEIEVIEDHKGRLY